MPAKLEALIGREDELARLRAMLSEHRAVTIIGPGGMGKTQCALEVGRQCEVDFPEADDWLRSLAGLGKSWIALRSSEYHEAIAMLEPLRRLGYDVAQHEMIDIYLGFTHHCLGHWRQAAGSSLDVLELAVPWRHVRSAAGAVETAAFLAMRAGRPETCTRLLGKAADIRERTRTTLFSFWVAYDKEAASAARAALGNAQFDAVYRAGASARDELVFDETRAFLREVAEKS